MVNKIFQVHPDKQKNIKNFLINIFHECETVLRTGGIIVYPTETLYGLGVDIYNDQAIERLIQLKRRPKNMPIAIAVANLDQVRALAMVSKLGLKIIENCIPKPITILLRATDKVNPKLTGGSALIGFRFPDHEVTKELISRFGPITATSANLHGGPNPLTIDSTLAQFGHKVGIYLDSGACAIAKPSTVIDATGETIKIIRHGACSGTELEECLSNRGN